MNWKRTGSACFPYAAEQQGQWWVLRVNSFPDHALYTLFVDGRGVRDVDDVPEGWGRPTDATEDLPAATAEAVLAPVADLVAHGSEWGRPCENPYCCG